MSHKFWNAFGEQLSGPHGRWGVFTGYLMRIVNRRVNSLTVDAVSVPNGGHIIEIGCGPGQALKQLLRRRPDVTATGIDHSQTMIEHAASLNAEAIRTGRLALQVCDFRSLPFADATVDAVLAINVAYFMNGPEALVEARRVLKPDGKILIYATHTASMKNWPFATEHSHRQYDEKALASLITNAGFRLSDAGVKSVDVGMGVKGLIAEGHVDRAAAMLQFCRDSG